MKTSEREPMTILVTGATGKVGQTFIRRFRTDPANARHRLRALCHNRKLPSDEGLEVLEGSIADCATVEVAMRGATHVLHLATCKEIPELVMDVTVKGLFWLLEAAKQSPDFRQIIIIGGDAAVGHFDYPRSAPVTEESPRMAYAGCYALSKVLEEVMLEQYYIQYGLNGCCLRASWIMEKDDFRMTQSFGEDVFGGPRWCEIVGPERARRYAAKQTQPVLLDHEGAPLKRNFIHVEDLVDAILLVVDNPKARQQLFNISMDRPVDYRELAEYLKETRGLDSIDIPSTYHSTWLDNTKARLLLGWRPRYDMARLVDSAWTYRRAADDPRVIYYPG